MHVIIFAELAFLTITNMTAIFGVLFQNISARPHKGDYIFKVNLVFKYLSLFWKIAFHIDIMVYLHTFWLNRKYRKWHHGKG